MPAGTPALEVQMVGRSRRVLEIVWFHTKIVSIRYNRRPPWGQAILKKDGVEMSTSQSKYSSSGNTTRDEPSVGGIKMQERGRIKRLERGNQRMRMQIEQNPQQREESHNNEEGEDITG